MVPGYRGAMQGEQRFGFMFQQGGPAFCFCFFNNFNTFGVPFGPAV